MKKLTIKDVEYIVDCLPEDARIEGNVLASGDELEDLKAEEQVRKQLADGNTWAWCTIRVTACLGGFTGTDYLGCCSYKSQADFEACGYFQDMKSRALEDLKNKTKGLSKSLKKISLR